MREFSDFNERILGTCFFSTAALSNLAHRIRRRSLLSDPTFPIKSCIGLLGFGQSIMDKALGNLADAIRLKIVGQSAQRHLWMVIDSVCLFSISVKSSKVSSLSFRIRDRAFTLMGTACPPNDSTGNFQASLTVVTSLSTISLTSGFSLSSTCSLLKRYGDSICPFASSSRSIL